MKSSTFGRTRDTRGSSSLRGRQADESREGLCVCVCVCVCLCVVKQKKRGAESRIKRLRMEREEKKHQTTKVPVFTLATGSKFLFITAATSSAALKDYFFPSGPAATFPSSPGASFPPRPWTTAFLSFALRLNAVTYRRTTVFA